MIRGLQVAKKDVLRGGWVGGWVGGFIRIMPRRGSILQAGTCKILSLVENDKREPSVGKRLKIVPKCLKYVENVVTKIF